MQRIEEILIDLDGILSNFVKGMCAAHNRPNPFLDGQNAGLFNMDKMWQMSGTQFWKVATPEWWLSLEPLPHAYDIVAAATWAVGEKNIAILTSPSKNKGCMDAKEQWVVDHFPQFNRKVMFCPAKGFASAPWRLLIDDYDKNYEAYTKRHGGPCFLYPQQWNSRFAQADDAFTLLDKYLTEMN